MRPLEPIQLERADSLIARGLTMEQVARALGVSRMTLYRAGYRSSRGYIRRA